MDAVSLNLVLHTGGNGINVPLSGHSLGAARVNTLVASGWAPAGNTFSLPFFAIPAQGVSGSCGNWDIVCFGAVQNALRDTISQTAPSPERNFLLWNWALDNHGIETAYKDFPRDEQEPWKYIPLQSLR